MIGYLIAFIVGILAMGYIFQARGISGSGGFSNIFRGKGKLILGFIILLLLIFLAVQSITIIQAGTVGVLKRLGAVKQDLSPGLHFILPFVDEVVLYPTIKKTYEASDIPTSSAADFPDIIISALTADGQQIR
ncbi:MAG TPA: SPFH domain-containing protein, partial [bacterium]